MIWLYMYVYVFDFQFLGDDHRLSVVGRSHGWTEASIGAVGQHFLRFPGFEKTQWGEEMPSGVMAAFNNPGDCVGRSSGC